MTESPPSIESCISQNIYITGSDEYNGKSVITLAMMEMLSGHAVKIGFFRPIIQCLNEKDELIRLVIDYYDINFPYEALYGCTSEEAHKLLADDRYEELLKIILAKYRNLKDQCDHVLCVGYDYSHGDSIFSFDFNADVANNLGCVMMPVLQAGDRDNEEIIDSLASLKHALHEHGCGLLATVINSVPSDQIENLRIILSSFPEFPVYAIPSEPFLEKPTMGNIADALGAEIFSGDENALSREINHYKVAAMLVPDFLGYVQDGDLIITPGDRSDIILASLLTYHSKNYPQIAGLLLTGHQRPEHQVQALINGLGDTPFAVLGVDTDTFTCVMAVSQVRARLNSGNERQIAKVLGLVENNINMVEIKLRLCSKNSTKITPLMFEYDLLQRAKAKKQHIVLPEGTEDRILRAAEILLFREVVKITLLGDERTIRRKIQTMALKLDDVNIIDPLNSELRSVFAETYFQARKHKNIVYETAFDLMADVSYFGTLMIHLGLCRRHGVWRCALNSTHHPPGF